MKRIYIQGAIERSLPLDLFGDWVADGLLTPVNAFLRDLRDANGEDIEVWVNSPGGSVDAANEMLAAFQSYKGYKCVTVGGLAASAAAFFVLQCGARVECHENTRMMFHSAICATDYAGPGELRDDAEALDKINAPVRERLVALGMDPARVEEGFSDGRALWIDAREALALGIVSKVAKGAAPLPVPPTPDRLARMPEGHAAAASLISSAFAASADMAAAASGTATVVADDDGTEPISAESGAASDGVQTPAPAEPTAEAPDSALASLRAEFEALRAELAEVRRERDRLKDDLEKAAEDAAWLAGELERVNEDAAASQTELAKLQAEMAATRTEHAALVGGVLAPAADARPLTRDEARAAMAALPADKRADFYRLHKAEIDG